MRFQDEIGVCDNMIRMPDSRRHRGAHPKDAGDFGQRELGRLGQATAELAWLLSRGSPIKRSPALVGARHALRVRQRKAIGRAAAARQDRQVREEKRLDASELYDRELWVDGYNVLLTVEAALGGGVLLQCMDGTLRDIAAMSSHYKRVEETEKALRLLGQHLDELAPSAVHWLLDRPISNSGRLRRLMLDLAQEQDWPWQVELVANPDAVLKRSSHVVATADSAILDACVAWHNLAREVVDEAAPRAWRVDLSSDQVSSDVV